MTRVKVHRNQLTLPAEAREKLNLADEGELDVEVIPEGVLLKAPASALELIREARAAVKLSPAMKALPVRRREEMIVDEVKAYRRARRPRGGRG